MAVYPTLSSFPRVQSYAVMLLLAGGLGWWFARRRARSLGIAPWQIDWLVPLLLVSCGLGTRVAGRLLQLLVSDAANDRVLYGGILLALITGFAYARVARIEVARLADAFAYSLPLGIGVIRVGCFLAGCCWGDLCVSSECLAAVDDPTWQRQVRTIPVLCDEQWPLHVRFPGGSPAFYQHLSAGLLPPGADRSLPVHPVQLYEAAASLALLCALVLIDRYLRWQGVSCLLFGLGYCLIRFVVEWFRADSELLPGALTVSQYASVVVGCACLLLLVARRRLNTAPRNRGVTSWPSNGISGKSPKTC